MGSHRISYTAAFFSTACTLVSTSSLSVKYAANSTSLPYGGPTGSASNSSWCTNDVGFWSPSADPFWSTKCSCSEFRGAQFSTSFGSYSSVDGGSTVTGKDFALYLEDSSRKIPMDCCYNCEVFAEDVSLFHWPVEENMGNISMSKFSTPYTLLSDGFTYISPSVYISYTNLIATVWCGSFTQGVSTGKEYNTLIAYPPEVLSSVTCTTHPKKGIGTACSTKALDYAQMQQLSFVLAFPPNYTLVDPEWKLSCGNSRLGLHDPPRTLHKTPYLVDPTSVGTQTPTATPGAKPTPGPIAPTPTPTATSGEKGPAGQPSTYSGLRGSDPPAVPVLSSAAISNMMHSLPSPPNSDDPGSNDGGDPQGAVGNNEGHSDPGSHNDPEDSRGGSNRPPTKDDPPLPSFRGNQIHEADGGGVVIGSTTLRPGDQIAQAGTSVSVGSDFIVIGGSTIPLATATGWVSDPNGILVTTPNTVNIADHTAVAAAGEGVIVSGHSPGAQPRTSDTAVLVDTQTMVVAGLTYALLPQGSRTPVLIAGQTIIKASNGGVIVGSSTYPPGTQATFSGTVLAVGSDKVVLGSSTYALPSNPTDDPTLVDGNPITRAPNGGVVIGDSTIAPGRQATFSGHTISAGVSSVIVDGSAFALPTSAGAVVYHKFGSKRIRLANGVVISAGGPAAIISGTTYSILTDDSGLIIDDQTVGFPTRLQSVFTIAGQTFTANPTGFAAEGHSISLNGSAITLSGTVVSLGPSGLQIGSSTIPLTPAQETNDVGLGGLIMKGFGDATGSAGRAANFSSPLTFSGGSVGLRDEMGTIVLAVIGLGIGAVAYAL